MIQREDKIALSVIISIMLIAGMVIFSSVFILPDKSEAKRSDGSSDYWYWETVTYDGHQYVKAYNMKIGCVVHSPNCPCLLKAEKQ